jgi:hypothetical protein
VSVKKELAKMEDTKAENQDGFPYDGDLASRSRARKAINKALAQSPRRFLGDELIRKLAADLEKQRKRDLPVITPCRLAMALRKVVAIATSYTNGSTVSLNLAVGRPENSYAQGIAQPANASTVKRAKKKLSSAEELINQLEEVLKSDEIAAFDTPSKEVLSLLRSELDRLRASVRVSPGLRRGRPPLLHLVQLVHGALHQLTGSRLRFRQDDERADRFIADTLHRICKPLIGNEFTDEDLGQTIETAIRSPRGRQKSGV